MDGDKNDNELSKWYSTYGLITAERILGRYNLKLSHEHLLKAMKVPASFYHLLLKVPLKNVFNGIILQQAHDYQVYVQKIFIDYLISGESGKGEDSPGMSSRETMEEERKKLLKIEDEYHQLELKHNQLISASQASVIKLMKDWKKALDLLVNALPNNDSVNKYHTMEAIFAELDLNAISLENYSALTERMQTDISLPENLDTINPLVHQLVARTLSIKDILDEFIGQTINIADQAKIYRGKFYDAILRTVEVIKFMSEYRIDPEQDQINRETLYFDKTIGEEKE